jgi:hypothetical protein
MQVGNDDGHVNGGLPLGRSLFESMLRRESLEELRRIVERNPNSFRERDGDSRLSLHLVVALLPDAEIIRILVDDFPESVRERTLHSRELPAHLIGHDADGDAVEYLINLYPEALHEKCHEGGRLPLHRAVASRAKPDVLRILVDRSPESIRVADVNGDGPTRPRGGRGRESSCVPLGCGRMVRVNPTSQQQGVASAALRRIERRSRIGRCGEIACEDVA